VQRVPKNVNLVFLPEPIRRLKNTVEQMFQKRDGTARTIFWIGASGGSIKCCEILEAQSDWHFLRDDGCPVPPVLVRYTRTSTGGIGHPHQNKTVQGAEHNRSTEKRKKQTVK
jgi:hypothetical protein